MKKHPRVFFYYGMSSSKKPTVVEIKWKKNADGGNQKSQFFSTTPPLVRLISDRPFFSDSSLFFGRIRVFGSFLPRYPFIGPTECLDPHPLTFQKDPPPFFLIGLKKNFLFDRRYIKGGVIFFYFIIRFFFKRETIRKDNSLSL